MTDFDGVVVRQYRYRGFGGHRYETGSGTFDVSNRYTGQIYDYDTGLYYYGSRYYDPALGRFIQPDSVFPDEPTGNSQALNRYSYVYNNPLKFTDPTGNKPRHKKKNDDEVEKCKNTDSVNPRAKSFGANNSSFDAGANTASNSSSGAQGVGNADNNGGSGTGTATVPGYNLKSAFTGIGSRYTRDVGQQFIGIAEGVAGTLFRTKDELTRVFVDTKGVASDIANAAKQAYNDLPGTAKSIGTGLKEKASQLVGDDPRASGRVVGEIATEAAITAVTVKATSSVINKLKGSRGLTTPKKFFSGKSMRGANRVLKSKYGKPAYSSKFHKSYFNRKSGRSFNIHKQPGYHGGKPHVDFKRRGYGRNYRPRVYLRE